MRPALAESWTVSPDQLAWTFHLRRGVTFHDGSPFTADDVVYSYRRIIDEKLANADKLSAVSGITASDKSTVIITLKQPTPNLLTNLGGFKGLAIVQRRNVESGEIATHPVGTGPFAFQSQKSGDSITLEANPTYWAGAPKVSGVTFRFISEPSTALSALQAGEIDWTDSIPAQRVAQLKDDDSITLATTPSIDYWYLALNEARAPWHDVRVRQAIAYAIDRDAIVQATSYGTAVANQLAIPKGNPWYTPYDTYRHDIERAKGLLRDAGAAPKTLDMLVTTEYPETVTAAQIIADNLAPLGITVNIRTVDFATWLDEQNNGHFDMLSVEPFVQMSRAMGTGDRYILARHIVPNIAGPLIVQTSLSLAFAILSEAALSFLGLGIQPPQPSLGRMIFDSQGFVTMAWWMAVFPGAAIFVIVLAFNLVGDGLRDCWIPSSAP